MRKAPRDLESWEADALREAPAVAANPGEERGTCPSLDLLRASQTETLPEEWQARVTGHLTACPLCRQLLADLDTLDATALHPEGAQRLFLDVCERARKEKAAGKGWGFFRRPAVAAFALALAALAVIWLGSRSWRPAPAGPETTQVKPPQAAPAAYALPLIAPEVKVTLATLTWRGGQSGQGQLLRDLAPAFQAYRAQDYEQAVALLQPLSSRHPKSVEVHFYLGVSRLLRGKPAEAVESLRAAERLQDDLFAPDVAWYLAVALERAGQPAEAISLLQGLCKGQSDHAAAACAGLEELSKRNPSAPGS